MVHPGFQLILILIYCLTDGYYSFNDYIDGNRSIGYVAHLCGAVGLYKHFSCFIFFNFKFQIELIIFLNLNVLIS